MQIRKRTGKSFSPEVILPRALTASRIANMHIQGLNTAGLNSLSGRSIIRL